MVILCMLFTPANLVISLVTNFCIYIHLKHTKSTFSFTQVSLVGCVGLSMSMGGALSWVLFMAGGTWHWLEVRRLQWCRSLTGSLKLEVLRGQEAGLMVPRVYVIRHPW